MSHQNGTLQPTLQTFSAGTSSVLRQLHAQCLQTLEQSLLEENTHRLGEIYLFAGDLDAWRIAIGEQKEVVLIETAVSEYLIAMLNVCQGQYRNGFKGLRLVLELCLQSTYLSANHVLRAEWLKGKAHTLWATLKDPENGPLSPRSCQAFFPDLSEHVMHFRQLADTLYAELSECIHGNVPNHIPLPIDLAFSKDTFELWKSKAISVKLIVHFSFVMRYLNDLPRERLNPLFNAVTEQLGHIPAVRAAFEQGK